MVLTNIVSRDYSVLVATMRHGLGILEIHGANRRQRGFFVRKISVQHHYVGLGGHSARGGRVVCPVFQPAQSGAMFGIVSPGLQPNTRYTIMNTLTPLTISDISIRQDDQGRYCLNDLHKSAGGESKHQPTNFLRLDTTKELIEELNRSSDMRNAIEVKQGGNQQGTYVVKELVYSYAMWISAKFHIQVIRAYDALVTQPQPAYEKITDKQKQELYRAAQNVCDKFYWMRDSSATQWIINGVRVIFNLSDLADLPATQFDLVLTHINSKEPAIEAFREAVDAMREEFYKTVLSGSAPWTPSLKSKHTQAYKQKLTGKVNWQEVQQKLLGA